MPSESNKHEVHGTQHTILMDMNIMMSDNYKQNSVKSCTHTTWYIILKQPYMYNKMALTVT